MLGCWEQSPRSGSYIHPQNLAPACSILMHTCRYSHDLDMLGQCDKAIRGHVP